MKTENRIKLVNKLTCRYQKFVEKAYNLRQTDEGKSDFYGFEATKMLQRINQLNIAQGHSEPYEWIKHLNELE